MAGYSGKPLVDKLGIRVGETVVALNRPENYADLLGKLPDGASLSQRAGNAAEFLHLFVIRRDQLEKQLRSLRPKLADTGILWISWPKKAARIATDVSEGVIRDIALPLGLVDTKVCAVDETWSGLKLMVRRENRAPKISKK